MRLGRVNLSLASLQNLVNKKSGEPGPGGITVTKVDGNAKPKVEERDPRFLAAYHHQERLQLCPETPPSLVGPLRVYRGPLTWEEARKNNPNVFSGGRYAPPDCKTRHGRVAIIVPYRDREDQLRLFLNHLHPILARQQLVYGIYVVDQAGLTKFNRALLFNIGYAEAVTDFGDQWDCFIFHDVDLMPEDDRNLYSCPDLPTHMSVGG